MVGAAILSSLVRAVAGGTGRGSSTNATGCLDILRCDLAVEHQLDQDYGQAVWAAGNPSSDGRAIYSEKPCRSHLGKF